MGLKERLETIERQNNNLLQEKNRLEGRIEALKQQMMEDFGTDDVHELTHKLSELQSQMNQAEIDLTATIEKMENQIGIND